MHMRCVRCIDCMLGLLSGHSDSKQHYAPGPFGSEKYEPALVAADVCCCADSMANNGGRSAAPGPQAVDERRCLLPPRPDQHSSDHPCSASPQRSWDNSRLLPCPRHSCYRLKTSRDRGDPCDCQLEQGHAYRLRVTEDQLESSSEWKGSGLAYWNEHRGCSRNGEPLIDMANLHFLPLHRELFSPILLHDKPFDGIRESWQKEVLPICWHQSPAQRLLVWNAQTDEANEVYKDGEISESRNPDYVWGNVATWNSVEPLFPRGDGYATGLDGDEGAPGHLPSAPAHLPSALGHLPPAPPYLPSASAHRPSAPGDLVADEDGGNADDESYYDSLMDLDGDYYDGILDLYDDGDYYNGQPQLYGISDNENSIDEESDIQSFSAPQPTSSSEVDDNAAASSAHSTVSHSDGRAVDFLLPPFPGAVPHYEALPTTAVDWVRRLDKEPVDEILAADGWSVVPPLCGFLACQCATCQRNPDLLAVPVSAFSQLPSADKVLCECWPNKIAENGK